MTPDISHDDDPDAPPNDCPHAQTFSKPVVVNRHYPDGNRDEIAIVEWCKACCAYRISHPEEGFNEYNWLGGF